MNIQQLVFIALLFTVGFLLHCLKAAGNAKRVGVSPSIGAWFVQYWSVLTIRMALLLTFFTIYADNAALAGKLFAYAGISLQYSLPVTKATSFLIGYFADSILDVISPKIPFLNRDIPQYQTDNK